MTPRALVAESRWTVLSEGRSANNKYRTLRVRCVCGTEKVVDARSVEKGTSKSCGCLATELAKATATPDSTSNHPLYAVWMAMRARCQNPNNKGYANYGGRGIRVDPRWEDFDQFVRDMGPKPENSRECSIERVDNDGPYSPENCVWGNRKQQNRNKRSSRLVTLDGETKTMAEWCDIYGNSVSTVSSRLGKGMSEAQAIKTPPLIVVPNGIKRARILITLQGRTQSLLAWSKEVGVNYHRAKDAVKAGVPAKDVFYKLFT